MASYSNVSRPAYVWDGVNNQWVPIGVGPHTHSVADMTNAVSNLGGSNIANTTATTVPLTVTGAVSQSADLLDVKNSAGTVVANIDANGNFAAQNANYAGKNLLINGAMEIDQRHSGASASYGTSGFNYTVDRWFLSYTGTTMTGQRVTGTNTGTLYSFRVTGGSSVATTNFSQRLESNHIAPYAGKTVTFSGKIYSSAASAISPFTILPSATDNYTSTTTTVLTSISLSAGLNTFSYTFTLPSGATNGVEIGFWTNGQIGIGATMEFANLQLELGTTATPFTRAGGTYQGELAACQRYYWRQNYDGSSNYVIVGHGAANSGTQTRTITPFPVQMRVKPTSIDYPTPSTYFSIITFSDSSYSPNNSTTPLVQDTNLTTNYLGWLMWNTSSSVLTTDKPYYVRGNNNSGAYIGWSAEL